MPHATSKLDQQNQSAPATEKMTTKAAYDKSHWIMSAEEQKACDDAKAKLQQVQGKTAEQKQGNTKQKKLVLKQSTKTDGEAAAGWKRNAKESANEKPTNIYEYLNLMDEDEKLVQAEGTKAGGKVVCGESIDVVAEKPKADALKTVPGFKTPRQFPRQRAGFEKKRLEPAGRRTHQKAAEKATPPPPPITDTTAWPELGERTEDVKKLKPV